MEVFCDTVGTVSISAIGAGFEAICDFFLSSFSDGGAFYPRVPRGSGLALHCAGR